MNTVKLFLHMGKLFGLSIFIFFSLRDCIDFSDMVMLTVIAITTTVFMATTYAQLIMEFIQY